MDACGSCVCVRPSTACVLNSGRSPLHVLPAQMKSEIHEGIYFLARRCSLECKHPGSMVCCFLLHLRWHISHIWQYGLWREKGWHSQSAGPRGSAGGLFRPEAFRGNFGRIWVRTGLLQFERVFTAATRAHMSLCENAVSWATAKGGSLPQLGRHV